MKKIMWGIFASLISLSAFASTVNSPYHDLEKLYSEGVNAKLSDFSIPLHGALAIKPETTRGEITDCGLFHLATIDLVLNNEVPEVPAAGPLFPTVPAQRAKIKKVVMFLPIQEFQSAISAELARQKVKDVKFSNENHGRLELTIQTDEYVEETVFKINNGLIIGKHFKWMVSTTDIEDVWYSYFWSE